MLRRVALVRIDVLTGATRRHFPEVAILHSKLSLQHFPFSPAYLFCSYFKHSYKEVRKWK
jgi:hypothetical protein